jgi:hypothetical protein
MEISDTPEEPIEFLFPIRAFNELRSDVLEEYGLDLLLLAKQNPLKAFQLILEEFTILGQSMQSAEFNGRKITRRHDGDQAYEGFVDWVIQQLNIDLKTTALNVDVLTSKPFFHREASILIGRTGLKSVLSFRVEPQNIT